MTENEFRDALIALIDKAITLDETALADEVRRLTDEKQALREALADVIFAAVLHPELPGLELVSGAVLDRARLFIKNDSDMAAAAERARAATAAKRAADARAALAARNEQDVEESE